MEQSGKFKDDAFKKRVLTYDQSTILLDQVYARVVTNPDALRQYKGKLNIKIDFIIDFILYNF